MPEPFKNHIHAGVVREHAAALTAVWSDFPAHDYIAHATTGLEALELKDRVRHVADALHRSLPTAFSEAASLLCQALPPPLPTAEAVSSTFAWWPFLQFVEDHGLEDPPAALDALERMTQTFSGEFAVRPLLIADATTTLARMMAWTEHPSVHVRRLASEGSRPRLPWGQRLAAVVADPGLTAPILEALKDDPELYVRRSVANHINDVSKDHPDRTAEWMGRWMADASDERAWVVRHALRGLVKAKHRGALGVLGFTPPEVGDAVVTVTPQAIALGEAVTVALTATAHADQRWMMDLTVLRPTATGTGRLVFKGVQRDVAAGQAVSLTKTLAIRPVTTRTYHSGIHRVQVVVNGAVLGEAEFALTVP